MRNSVEPTGNNEVEFFTAVLAISMGTLLYCQMTTPMLLPWHRSRKALQQGGLEDDETPQDNDLPFDAELIPRSIAGSVRRAAREDGTCTIPDCDEYSDDR